MEEFDDVGTCPKCGEDSTGVNDVCHTCREDAREDDERFTPFG